MPNEVIFNDNEPEGTPIADFYAGKQVLFDRVKRYMEGKRRLLTAEMRKNQCYNDESIFVQYPKRYFEAIIYEMEKYGADGIRIYFGEYENNANEEAAGQLGLLMLLTKTNAEMKVEPVYLEEQPGFLERLSNARSRGIDTTIINIDDVDPREIDVCRPCPPACPKLYTDGFPEDGLS